MKITINLEKKHIYFLALLVVVLIGVTLVVAYGTSDPSKLGHTAGEIEFGDFLVIPGAGGEKAYIGGDGVGNDVQIGSSNSDVSQVNFLNLKGDWMDIKALSICTYSGVCLTNHPWTTSGSDIYYNTGKVGIGTASPTEKLDVFGNIKATGTICDSSGKCIGSNDSQWTTLINNIYYNSGNVGIGTASGVTPTNRLQVDIRSTVEPIVSQIRFQTRYGGSYDVGGGYLTSVTNNDAALSAGVEYKRDVADPTKWTARSAKASIIQLTGGNIGFYGNVEGSLPNVGSLYNPTKVMLIQGFNTTANSGGKVAIGHLKNPTTGQDMTTNDILSSLHIYGDNNMGGAKPDWISTSKGVLITADTDFMYTGLRNEGTDSKQAVIAWGDNLGNNPLQVGGPNVLRFIFVDTTGTSTEIMRLLPNGSAIIAGDLKIIGYMNYQQRDCTRITYTSSGNVMCPLGYYAAGIWDDGNAPTGPNGLVCCR